MACTVNLADPELELIDPTPNIYLLFINFDKMFFATRLASRAVVRWSKRMYSCAGVCSYEGRGGLCDIALSEPLLKLRPRKDLVETLLHEMIHAFLFVTGNDRDRDGHGPNFQAHMHRINKAAGVKITIYHSFHDEVKLYQTHWWRCDGPCQQRKPYFGIVRRPTNRKPGPYDFWWDDHMRKCGGNFIKIKGPEKPVKGKKAPAPKPMGDITKYINNNDCPKNNNTLLTNGFTKTNVGNSNVASQKSPIDNPTRPPVQVFAGKGYTVSGSKIRGQSVDNIADVVRDVWLKKHSVIANAATNTKALEDVTRKVKEVWANKTFGNMNSSTKTNAPKPKNNKRSSITTPSAPPAKVKKIDDFFTKGNAILKDIYGDEFNGIVKIRNEKNNASKDNMVQPKVPDRKSTIIEIPNPDLVDCPICKNKVKSEEINRHIDECLNKEEIDKLARHGEIKVEPGTSKTTDSETVVDLSYLVPTPTLKEIIDIKGKPISKPEFIDSSITVGDLTMFITKINNTDPTIEINTQLCPCCELIINKSMDEHLDECLAFPNNDTTISEQGASTSYTNTSTIVIKDDDDIFDESLTLNATGTKSPCPVCLTMIEQDEMNNHLDQCLS